MLHELSITDEVIALPSIADTAQLRRRHGRTSSYRKNVCFITLNGSWNGASFLNCFNGFGGF
ncbi:MAG TPA: hypothetical protein VFI41_05060 [Gemmatimonadales bacterium]|nr:hypothetical protein [Gemmatimonadales bacterium]